MPLIRGMVYMTYTADDLTAFQTLVDADEAAIPSRGWTAAVAGGDLIPRGFKERRVHGVSPTSGRRASCRVGSTTADLWTGVTHTFTVEADDNTIDTFNVTGQSGERRRRAH